MYSISVIRCIYSGATTISQFPSIDVRYMISPQEAAELRRILEEERNEAMNVNDVLALFAIGGLLFILTGFLLGYQR